jgi:hypothetical protein
VAVFDNDRANGKMSTCRLQVATNREGKKFHKIPVTREKWAVNNDIHFRLEQHHSSIVEMEKERG